MGWLIVAVVFALVGVVSVTLELDRTRWARWRTQVRHWADRARDVVAQRTVPTSAEHALAAGAALLAGFGLARLGQALAAEPGAAPDTAAVLLAAGETVVGLPLLAWLLWRLVGRLREDGAEHAGVAWLLHCTVVSMVSLALAVTAAAAMAGALARSDAATPHLVTAAVWMATWLLYWVLSRTFPPTDPLGVHQHSGVMVGLVLAAAGAGTLLARSLSLLAEAATTSPLSVDGAEQLVQPLALLVLGGWAWQLYWRRAREGPRSPLGDALVVLVGSAGGLLLALVGTWLAVSDVLVWLLGDVRAAAALARLPRLPAAISLAVVGLLVWRFHTTVYPDRWDRRTELLRARDYFVAAVGLLGLTVGGAWLVAAGIEWATGLALDRAVESPASALLRAATLALVGLLAWRPPWARVQRLVTGSGEAATATSSPRLGAAAPPTAVAASGGVPPLVSERRSPVRRTYLAAVTVIWGTAAVAAFLLALLGGLEDLLDGRSGAAALHAIRLPLAVMVAAGVVAVGHSLLRAAEPKVDIAAPRLFPSHVLLIGRTTNGIVADVATLTGADVELWRREDAHAGPWHPDAIASALYRCGHDDVMVVSTDRGIEVVPVRRE